MEYGTERFSLHWPGPKKRHASARFILFRVKGVTQGEAARAVGVHRQVVNRWVRRHLAAGAVRGSSGSVSRRRYPGGTEKLNIFVIVFR
jgi:DNA-binding Lrp family transcriptional regulator